MAKLIISKDLFAERDIFTDLAHFRFRISTDDQNVISYWSPIYSIDPGFEYITNGEIFIEKHSEYTAIVWNPVQIEKDGRYIGEVINYDLWVRWGTEIGDGEWFYKERVSSTSVSLIKPDSPSGLDHLSIEIYRPGRPIQRKNIIDVYQDNTHVDLTNDTITFNEAHNFETGKELIYTVVSPELPIGGLTSGNSYWARKISDLSISLYPTELDAINNSNKINLTSHPNSTGFFQSAECPSCAFLLYSKYNFSPA